MKSSVNVLYSDNHILIAEKPAGMLTQKDHTDRISFEQLVKKELELTFLVPVHRLDRQVSGLILFAKSSKALSRLNKQMREGQIKKTYYAHVEGNITKSEGTLEDYLIHDNFKARIVSSKHPKAKRALLSYKVIQKTNRATFVKINLQTGRYHQIRAQLAHFGHPILGDYKYGSHKEETIALHHGELTLIHPVLKTIIKVKSGKQPAD